MSHLTTVKLYGELGDRFGREFHLHVKNAAEAIRLLSANFKDFGPYLIKNSEPGYHIVVGTQDIDIQDIRNPVSSKEIIKIIPVVSGSGSNPYIRIVIGAVLMYYTGTAGGAAFFGTYASTATAIGASLILGGVSQILFAPPKPKSQEAVENQPSYMFNGAVNTIRQGNPVPVGYGRLRVGSQVVSAGMFSEAI